MVREVIQAMNLDEYADGGPAELDMSLNVNPLGVSDKAVEAIRSLDEQKICRYRRTEDRVFEKTAEFLGTVPENLLLTNGCDGALNLLSTVFFETDVSVAVPVPSFPRYEFHVRKAGAEPVFLESREVHLGVDDMVDCDADYLLLADPQNPSGESFECQELERLVDEFEGKVIIDEALSLDPGNPELVERGAIIVGSFSKILGLAGLRAGYIVSSDIENLEKVISPFQVNSAAQEALLQVVQDKEYLRRTTDTVKRELEYLKSELQDAGFSCTDSATMNLLVDLEGTRYEGDSTVMVEELSKNGVKVVDGSNFRGLDSSHIRISVRDHQNNQKFIEKLRSLDV